MAISDLSKKANETFELVKTQYECHDHRHAVAILTQDFPELFVEICQVMLKFRLMEEHVVAPGGNRSMIPKTFSDMLKPLGWVARKLKATLVLEDEEKKEVPHSISLDTHEIDHVKGKVALELEWNSKDQTFDRDLYAFRAFFEYGEIAVGILVTRSTDLDPYFGGLGAYEDKYGTHRMFKQKYGASTTHMNKLLPRLDAGRGGGCPILAIGITQKQLERNHG